MNRTTPLLATLLALAGPSMISLAAPPASDATVKAQLDAYIASTQCLRDLASQQQIDVSIPNHSGVDEAPAKLARLHASRNGTDPFVLGTPTVHRALMVMGECAQAQRDASPCRD